MELSKMLGAERNVPFRVKGLGSNYKINLNRTRKYETLYIEMGKSTWLEVCHVPTIIKIISGAPDNIIHLPPQLTDEQRVVFMSLFTMGARYMVMTTEDWKRCFVNKPRKELNRWTSGDTQVLTIAPGMANCLDSLVSWSDPEPFDIGKALGVGE